MKNITRSNGFSQWATPSSVISYAKPDRYHNKVAHIIGYWVEDRIFGGVVLFGRGASGTGATFSCINTKVQSSTQQHSRITRLFGSPSPTVSEMCVEIQPL